MNTQQLEQQFIGKLFSYKGTEFFCKDISISESTIIITTDKKAIRVAKTAWNVFMKDVVINNGNPNHIELTRKRPKQVVKSELKEYIGKLLKKRRLEMSLTMEDLGSLSGKGKKFVWSTEKGENNFRINDIEDYCKLINLDFQDIIITKYLTENAINNH